MVYSDELWGINRLKALRTIGPFQLFGADIYRTWPWNGMKAKKLRETPEAVKGHGG